MEALTRPRSTRYPQIAELYDRLKSGDDYDTWVALLTGLARAYGNGGRRLLDVGCGTGLSSRAFRSCGFSVTACDVEPAMLAVAAANPLHRDIRFVRADMRDLPEELGAFDVISWVDDVANHLPGSGDLGAALASSAARLAPGGVLLFDVNTLVAFREMFASTTVLDLDDVMFTFTGQTPEPAPDAVAHTRLIAFQRIGRMWRRVDASMQERHFSDTSIRQAIAGCGLRLVSTHGLHGRSLVRAVREDLHHKVIYCARRS